MSFVLQMTSSFGMGCHLPQFISSQLAFKLRQCWRTTNYSESQDVVLLFNEAVRKPVF